MAGIVTTASEKTLNVAESRSDHILEQMEQYAEDNPLATEFYLENEEQAAQILLSMAASIKHLVKDVKHKEDQRHMVTIANQYRKAVIHNRALELFCNMTDEDQLEMYGLKLLVRRIVLQ